jgi:effector-binding domain-containing protein
MFDSGLSSLKDMAEKKAAETPATPTGSYTVQELDFKGATYLGIRQQTTHAEVMKQEFFAKRFGTIMGALEKAKLQPAGLPAGVYYTWDEASKTTDMAVAIPVAKGTAVAGDPSLKTFEVPAGRALVVDYYGPYEGTAAAHEALTTYVKEKGLTEKAPVIEEYVTDPETEKDPTKWLTKVYYFVEAKK